MGSRAWIPGPRSQTPDPGGYPESGYPESMHQHPQQLLSSCWGCWTDARMNNTRPRMCMRRRAYRRTGKGDPAGNSSYDYELLPAESPALSHAFWMMSNLVIHRVALGWCAYSFLHSACGPC